MLILRVAIPTPIRKLFDYLAPESALQPTLPFLSEAVMDVVPSTVPDTNLPGTTRSLIGARVLVPFRSQKKVGIIIEVTDQTEIPLQKLKAADAILDHEPLLSTALLKLMQWASRYYQTSVGEVFESAVPKRLRQVPKIKPEKPKKVSTKKKKIKSLEETPIVNASINTELFKENETKLNKEQNFAVETILHQLQQNTFKTFLLQGVTGSGKTEVYIRAVQAVLKLKKQALLLVPEIGLTPQLVARFQERFSVPIAVLNSALTDKQRYLAFESARSGQAPIVIGTRSAAFVPLKNPGIFIIDEEHDASFKQQEGFRYHARDILIMRASYENCPIVLGSATPSLETLHNAKQGRFQNLPLPSRAGLGTFPTVRVLDIRHKKCEAGLSAELLKNIREHLHNQGQVLLFLNRRGFAPILMCFECGWVAECKHCDARLTLHYGDPKLQCHHCESFVPIPAECPVCRSHTIKPVGVGTERLEACLQKHFPNHGIARIDRDTTRKKGSLAETLDRIHAQETDILIGTQMIAKGHHFPNVTLVGILDVDHALFSLDFRSIEKLGQLITQVAGRTGRAEKPGHVILQTCHPEHPLLKKLLAEGYLGLSHSLLTERLATLLPPYSYQALIRVEAKTLVLALQFLNSVKKQALESIPHAPLEAQFKLLGPVAAPMERRLGKHRAQLLFQANQRSVLQNLLQMLTVKMETHALANAVRWSLDVDPIEMY